MSRALERAVRAHGGRIVAALAIRFRDLDLAEEAFAEACARAVPAWREGGDPANGPGWLYSVAIRCALDAVRRRRVRDRAVLDSPASEPTAEAMLTDESRVIPDERLKLIFVCCHPAVAAEARAALTLRLVCGLSTREIARAFLLSEAAMAQRLVRAKRKIADSGVAFDIPRREHWGERLGSVLSTLEVAYAKSHEDAAGAGAHAGFAREMLDLTKVLADMLPGEREVLAFAALVRYAEARRPARLNEHGAMVPLSEQDPALWRRGLIAEADALFASAARAGPATARTLRTAIHALWCTRRSLEQPSPWPEVLAIYDHLVQLDDNPIVRLNRLVALAEVEGPARALADLADFCGPALEGYLPYHAVRADLLRRVGQDGEADLAYRKALALGPEPAERAWLTGRRAEVSAGRREEESGRRDSSQGHVLMRPPERH